jgi:hypothetical protein
MKLLTVVGTVATAAIAEATSFNALPAVTRRVQDENGNSYAYLDDISGYSIQYSTCVRVKLPNEYDDDNAEGNTFYYNGRYHAQFSRYATFHLCTSDGMQCSCDTSVEYSTEMNQFLQNSLQYLDNYCAGGNCGNYYNDNGADESRYLECSEGHQDEDGTQYYYGPQCDENSNGIVIGVFYDEDCTIKTKNTAPDLNYYKFQTVESTCVDCNEADYCNELYEGSYHCANGKDLSGNQDGNVDVCGTVKKYLYSHDYSNVKTRKSGEKAFLKVFFSLVALSLLGGFIFLTYTYYIRHRNGGAALLTSDQLSGEAAPGTLT